MNIRLAAFLFSTLIAGLVACEKNDDAPTTKLNTGLNVSNASADTVNLYLNGSRLNNNSNLYPTSSTQYLTVLAGSQNYQVKKIFNPVTSVVQPLFSKLLALDTNGYNSFFIAGETADKAFSVRDTLQLDTIPNTCLVRFINASPTTGNLDAAFGDTTQFKHSKFGDPCSFTLVGISGIKPVTIYQSGTNTVLYKNIVILLPGKSYTFFSKGKLQGTGTSIFGIGSTINVN